jgi:lysyl-tRNA synthetase class II
MDERASQVETPNLQESRGARPFTTYQCAGPSVSRIALELHLKRLVVGGLTRLQRGRVFRNEGVSTKYNPSSRCSSLTKRTQTMRRDGDG